MRIIAWRTTVIPSLMVGISTGRVVASLDAPAPTPTLAAITVTVVAAYVLDRLISTLLAHRAANRH